MVASIITTIIIALAIYFWWRYKDVEPKHEVEPSLPTFDESQGTPSVLFEVFKIDNTLLISKTVTVSGVSIGDEAHVNGDIDLGQISPLLAYSVRVTITPTNVQNYAQSYDSCNVSDGPVP